MLSDDLALVQTVDFFAPIVDDPYLFGQIALDPASGQVVAGGVPEQTEQVLKNLTAVLEAAGSSWTNVVKTTVFLKDMRDFPTVNEVYARMVGDARPARSTVAVAGLPRDVLVEIEAVATVNAK